MVHRVFEADDFHGGKEILVKKGECLIYRGDKSEKVAYFLVSGSVDVKTECVDGSQIILYTLLPGEMFGELAFMGVNERTVSIYAAEDSRLIRINEIIWKQNTQNHAFQEKVFDLILNRFLELTEVVNRLGQTTVEQRLSIFLLSFPEWRESKAEQIYVKLPPTTQLAAMTNCTRERMSAILRKFQQSGAICKTDNPGEVQLSHSLLLDITN